METIKININVQVGVTKELYAFLNCLTSKSTSAPMQAVEVKPSEAVEVKPSEAVEVKPEPEAPSQQELAEDREYTEVDVRDAMERTRKRIEGENYKNETDSEGYKKYHRKLTASFKEISALLGSDKPSTLPTSDKRKSFCQQVDELVAEGDEIVTKVPF